MPAFNQTRRVNEHTTLIDIGMFGVAEVAGVYLVEGEKSCLIDSGSQKEAKGLVKALKSMGAFPPDKVILTHAHYDHAQGVPLMVRQAESKGEKIEIMASREAVPLLADARYNDPFNKGPYESITGVDPLDEGDLVDLGGVILEVLDAPGHSKDHIAIFDQQNKTLFVGDAVGIWIDNQTYLPPFMPPSWNPESFSSTINKLRNINYDQLCLAHFGVVSKQEGDKLLDEAEEKTAAWWRLFEENEDKLEQPAMLLEEVKSSIDPPMPERAIISPTLKVLYTMMVAGKKLTGKEPQPLSEISLLGVLEFLASGYKTYQQSSA